MTLLPALFLLYIVGQSDAQKNPCQFRFSRGCVGSTCTYDITWELHGDNVMFTINAQKQMGYWTGVGFSRDRRMANSDLIVGWANSQNTGVISDRWAVNYAEPKVDAKQSILSQSASFIDGMTSVSFSRKIDTGDQENDIRLDSCPYFFFPTHGGTTTRDGSINYHSQTPRVYGPICSLKCDSANYLVDRGYCPGTSSSDISNLDRKSVGDCLQQCDGLPACKAMQYNASESTCALKSVSCTPVAGVPGTLYQDTFTYTKRLTKLQTTTTPKQPPASQPRVPNFDSHAFNCPGNVLLHCQNYENCGGSLKRCADACRKDAQCRSFAYNKETLECFLKKIGLCAEKARVTNPVLWFYVKGEVTTTTAAPKTTPVVTTKPQGPSVNGYVQYGFNCPGNIERVCSESFCQSEQNCGIQCSRSRLCKSFAYDAIGKECFQKSIGVCDVSKRKYNNPTVLFYVKEFLVSTTTSTTSKTGKSKTTTATTKARTTASDNEVSFKKLGYNCPGNALPVTCSGCTTLDDCKNSCKKTAGCKGFSFKKPENECYMKSIGDCDPADRVVGNPLVDFYSRTSRRQTTTSSSTTAKRTTTARSTTEKPSTTPSKIPFTTTQQSKTTPKCNEGPRGEQGPMGPQGPKGDRGQRGAIGPSNGDPGPPGPRGQTGDKGGRGQQGFPGPPGDRGQRGLQGPKGIQGPLGLRGQKGDRGFRGAVGEKGGSGPIGIKGDLGDKGSKGSPGPVEGKRGDKGEKGEFGQKGERGLKGTKGEAMVLKYATCPHSRCDANSKCINLYSDYVCKCNKGYKPIDKHTCRDINECQEGYCEQECDNFNGDFRCKCRTGFRLANNSRACIDMNECTEAFDRNGNCGDGLTCVNTVGSYSCIPDKNAIHDQLVKDRCAADIPCAPNQICVNGVGAYQCITGPQPVQAASKATADDMDETFNRAVLILGLLIWLIVLTIIILFIILCMCMLKKEERKRAHYLYEHDDMAMGYDNAGIVAEPWEG